MVARPGAFCDAMVTRKNGTPTLSSSEGVNCGVIHRGATKTISFAIGDSAPVSRAMIPRPPQNVGKALCIIARRRTSRRIAKGYLANR